MQSDECWEEEDNHTSLSTAIILLTQPRIFAACAHWWLPASSLWTRTWLMSHKSRIFSGKFFPSLYGCKDFLLLNCTIDCAQVLCMSLIPADSLHATHLCLSGWQSHPWMSDCPQSGVIWKLYEQTLCYFLRVTDWDVERNRAQDSPQILVLHLSHATRFSITN